MTEFAMHRLGQASLLISPNNPASAVAGLLKATNTHILIASERLFDTASEAAKILSKEGFELQLLPEKVFPLFGADGIANAKVPSYPLRFKYEEEYMRTCITLHSSGSVGLTVFENRI